MSKIPAQRFDTMAELEGVPGAFSFEAEDKGIFYNCPCGCDTKGFIPFRNKVTDRPSWNWDGNRDAPTLDPSIQRTQGCKWHGHLIAGVWQSA